MLMAYTLGNKYAKNLCKRSVLVQLIIETWSHVFLEQCIGLYAVFFKDIDHEMFLVTAVTFKGHSRSLKAIGNVAIR